MKSYGWRGRIGYLSPTLWNIDRGEDFKPLLPPGVLLVVASLGVTSVDETTLRSAFERAEMMATFLAKEADVMVLAGQPVYTLPSEHQVRELLTRIKATTGKPTTTSMLAAVEALKTLKARRVVFVTPTDAAMGMPVKNFLVSKGFEVTSMKTMDIVPAIHIGEISSNSIYRLAKEGVVEGGDTDAILMNCGRMPVLEVIDKLETDLGKPVVTTQQATVWWGLKQLGIKDKISGYGSILETL